MESDEGVDCVLAHIKKRHQKLLSQTAQYKLGDYFPAVLDLDAVYSYSSDTATGYPSVITGIDEYEYFVWDHLNVGGNDHL